MQLNIEEKSSVKKVLHIEIPKEDVAKELDTAYNELKKTATVKGFRKGKIPRKILETRFSKDVHADLVPHLVQNAFSEALDEHKFNLVGGPQVDPPELTPGEALSFDISIEVMPELEAVDFKGIELKKTMYEATDQEVDAQIQMIRKTMATKEKVTEERPVKVEDFVLIDYQGFVDGAPCDAAPKVENYVMAIGSNTLPAEFSEKLLGAIPVKEMDIDVVYADDDKDEALAGKTVIYKVTLKEIQEQILPPVDDTLVENLGQYKNLDELKAAILDNLKKGYEQRTQHELSEQIFTDLLEKIEFEVPDTMVDAELQGIIAEAEQAYAQNNIKLEDVGLSQDFLKTQYRGVAEKQARRHILLGKIIDQENLELTEDELEAGYAEMALGMNASVDAVKNFFKMDGRQLEYYKHTQLEKKAVRLIIEQGSVTEVAPEVETEVSESAADVEDKTDQ
ncbi:FKBP-type peptidyl-prolyl cis-trans isomerase (trigger factor) [Desulforapulum autotrophicum HRM2]|uniref:Trigger factor n=1 Tax=Desulforapulum autotrophicum (strain ATCC 43914 / DSM 3382 / VKM B-1955 / HRM2) TaxID=177437 RepID=TIG_DESAH|nr:trigger factor [Desulforapulum autotrophicum]C0QGS9.1 RecName: Full=Trigger factor; Short=TF; AltName: Full=PPIase [Desulforapulum autotrophicum HRM2]ACN13554.1 FKBP-type peptidyl-prolyl cis-trans isomerase (trigger factor) [Desulforapulum autotrophicum HRM2]